MKNYFKYLLSAPKKLAWSIGVLTFITVASVAIIRDWDIFVDNPLFIVIGVPILLVATLIGGLYHPYFEWSDGIKKEAEQEANNKSAKK